MAKKVLYIKIARIDQNGNDLTSTLESLTQITIPLTTSGNKTYKILTRSDFPTYYLFQIDLNTSPDAATLPNTTETTLDYEISSPLDDFATGSSIPQTVGRYKNTSATGGQTVTDFYNSEQQRIEINTMPKKDLHFIIGGENPGTGNTFQATLTTGGVGFAQTASVELYQSSPPYTTFTKLTNSSPTRFLTTADPTKTLDLSVSIPKENFSPGDIIFLGVAPDGTISMGANLAQVQLSNPGGAKFTRKLHVTSSAAQGPELENIVEPYLVRRFINSDCDVLINNADQYRDNPFLQDIDFSSGTIVPVNYDQIVTGTAQKATVPESMFTMGGMINPNNSGINQVDKYNISGSSYFGQSSGATHVLYHGGFGTNGAFNNNISTFIAKYIITPNGESIEVTNDDDSLNFLRRLFGSNANPEDLLGSASFGDPVSIKTRAIPISGSISASGALEFNGMTTVQRQGDTVVIKVRHSGSAPALFGGPGIVYPASIELTSHKDLPSKAREILTKGNVIPPAN